MLALAATALGAITALCFAQDADLPRIRVEAREVTVPVLVLRQHESETSVTDFDVWPPKTETVGRKQWLETVKGLSARNFRVFEDGNEQKIKSVAVTELSTGGVRDNCHQHSEYALTPRGIWATPDLNPDLLLTLRTAEPGVDVITPFDVPYFFYLISYVPPRSPEGSCHRIEVKLARVQGKLYARNEYCTTNQPASDPLLESKHGKDLEVFLASSHAGSLPLSAQVGWSFGDLAAARIHFSVDLPLKAFDARWDAANWIWIADISILGLVYEQSGALAAASVKGTRLSTGGPRQRSILGYLLLLSKRL